MTQELTLIERAQQALRGEEPWEPIMGRIHAFVRGDLDAQIAALTERLRAVEAERDALRRATGDNRKGDAVDEITLLKRELSALREELQRKDAALKEVLPWLERETPPQYVGVNSEGLPVEYEPTAAEEACGMAAMVLRAALEKVNDHEQ